MSLTESPLFHLRNLILDAMDSDKNHFLGSVLTIIDASIPDPVQRKGLKDLIKTAYYASRWAETPREVLYAFAEKYAPDTLPKTKDETDAYHGIFNGSEEPPKPKYF